MSGSLCSLQRDFPSSVSLRSIFLFTILADEKNIHRNSTEILNVRAEEEWLALRKTDDREIL